MWNSLKKDEVDNIELNMRHTKDEGPRRRTSVTTKAHDDIELISPQQGSVSSSEAAPWTALHRQPRKWTTVLLVFGTVVATIFMLWMGFMHEEENPLPAVATSDDDAPHKTLGILLHAEQHVHREPQKITLDWYISTGIRAPDGVKKRVYLINGLFPGPTVEVRSHDELSINVHNNLDDEGVAIHWHGLQVPNNMDGAVGFTQCPIQPGSSFTYRFNVSEQYGTYWWHAHFQSQRGDGLFGGFVIHAPQQPYLLTDDLEASYEKDIMLMVGDWFHRSADEVLKWYVNTGSFGNEPVPDSLLINGMGRFECDKAVAARPVDCTPISEATIGDILRGRVPTRLRLINVGTVSGFSISVTGATLRAVSVDGSSPIVAGPADSVGIVYPGERVDVVLQWLESQTPNSRLHITLDPEYDFHPNSVRLYSYRFRNFKYTNPSLQVNQSFPVGGGGAKVETNIQKSLPPTTPFLNLELVSSVARSSLVVPTQTDFTILLYVKTQKLSRFNNQPRGFINHTSWVPQTPPLLSIPRSIWDKDQLVPYVPIRQQSDVDDETGPVWIDLVINNLDDGSHPFHLHGHSFYVISRFRAGRLGGWGSWNPYSGKPPPGGLELYTPLLKDTVSVPRRGHVVLRLRVDKAGLWMLHCHMLVHLGSGMAAGIHIGLDGDQEHVLETDDVAASLCTR